MTSSSVTPPDVARLAREAAELLREREWLCRDAESRVGCETCYGSPESGHAPTCRLARVLGELDALGSEGGK